MLTREATYAVQVILFLASPENQKGSTAFAIHDELDIPYAFLRNILRRLAMGGIVHSKRGRTGGVTLIKNPAKLTVLDIVNTLEAERNRLNQWKNDGPKRNKKCPVQELFRKAQDAMDDVLTKVTITQLLAEATEQ